MGVSKNRGKTPKIHGENKGKPYFLNGMIWGVFPLFLVQHPQKGLGHVSFETHKISSFTNFGFIHPKQKIFQYSHYTLPETNSSPLKIGRALPQKDRNCIFQPLIFTGICR